MDSIQNWKDDLEKYSGMWEKALEDGVFKDAPKPPAPKSSFFGIDKDYSETPIDDIDSKYWNDVYNQSVGKEEVITEERLPSKEDIKNHAEKLANSHNPVQLDTVGKDNEYQDEYPNESDLQELIDLKLALEKLEIKMNTDDGLGQKSDVQTKIESLKKQIDELSDSLNGSRYN